MKNRIRLKYNAPVVLTFVLLCFAATLLGQIGSGFLTRLLFSTYRSAWLDPLAYLRLFTHVLGHADWSHFAGNAIYILLLGPMLEEKYGAKTLLYAMLATAFATGLLNALLFSNVALLGASGIVFSFILLSSFTSFSAGDIPLTAIVVAILYIGQEIVNGVFLQDNISNMAHIVGGVIGTVFGYCTNIRKKKAK
ncbi:MAG: rhomboid family intramembrane serine protease [Clostridia bacterium]|nr:rhomboid family intramembrane serine protease [Clostridia bacterium]